MAGEMYKIKTRYILSCLISIYKHFYNYLSALELFKVCYFICFVNTALICPYFIKQGFDEYMNLVLDDAEEVHMKTKNRKPLGRIMLKGDNITLLQSVAN
uniref:Small nuclear ribonucleoprotein E n=1 Tax=Paramormyrops kingsleyae TaxID=1676925 RepID=A0A3B3SSZ4_9TELE